MSDKKNKLELYIADKLKRVDKFARPTPGSGCGSSVGDVSNKYFFIESKIKHSKENIIIDYKKEWLTLLDRMSLNNNKTPLIFTENKYGEKFVTLNSDDFFELVYKIYGDQND